MSEDTDIQEPHDDGKAVGPPVRVQPLVLPCASCGAGPAPEPVTHCWWCGEKLGIKSTSNPSVEQDQAGIAEREASCNSMVSIHDLIPVQLLPEDHRCVEPSCPLYKLPRAKETLLPTAFFDFCDGCKAAMNVRLDDPLYDLSRGWVEQCEAAGDLLPLPDKLVERLDRMAEEILGPDADKV